MKAVSRRIMAPKRGGSMATACIAQSTLQVHGISKPIVVRFDQPQASSDGGAILLKVVDDRLGLTWRLASALRDRRQPGKVMHPLRDLLRQRVFGLACGYADCNDAARLAHDPIHKLLLERDPLAGAALGSQPTLSRFENAVGRTDLYRLGTAVADAVLIYHRERLGEGVRLITIDLDATDDPTHGQQEFALFNGYYDTWCYLPLIATMTFDTEPLQHIVAALLRPGTGAPTRGVRGCCAGCSPSFTRCFRARGCGSGPMRASSTPSCWPSSTRRKWSMCWGWRATGGWTSACGGCSAGRACGRGPRGRPPRCTARRATPPGAGIASGASS